MQSSHRTLGDRSVAAHQDEAYLRARFEVECQVLGRGQNPYFAPWPPHLTAEELDAQAGNLEPQDKWPVNQSA
jgi:hypothetical protein